MKRKIAWVLVLVACFGLLLVLKSCLESVTKRPSPRELTFQPVKAGFQSKFLKRYHLGFSNAIAGLLWVQFLQMHEHVELKEGEVSWEYAMLDSITTLDPRFQRAFHYGAILLSVLRQDKLGAMLIMKRWLRYNPTHWRTHFLYGYHLYFEMGRFKEAAKYVLRAASMKGAPFWLSSLGVRLLSESGSLVQALRVTTDLYVGATNKGTKERLVRRLRSLNFALQKTTWTEALEAYRKKHKREPSGTKPLYPFMRKQARELSSFLHSENVHSEVLSILAEKFSFRYDSSRREMISERKRSEYGIDRVGIHWPKNAPGNKD